MVKLKWNKAKEAQKYRIYIKSEGLLGLAGETAKNSFTIENVSKSKWTVFIVKSVDAYGIESDKGTELSFYYPQNNLHLTLSIFPSYYQPLGDYYSMLQWGVGGVISVNLKHVFINNLMLGFEGGFYYLGSNSENFSHELVIVPAIAAAYRFELFDNFYIYPRLGFGYHLSFLTYDVYGSDTFTEVFGYSPFILIGAGLSWHFKELSVQCTVDYHMNFETESLFHNLIIQVGVGYDFLL